MNLTDLANARSGFSQEMNNLLTLIAGSHTAEQRSAQINVATAECFTLCKTAKAVRVANPNSLTTEEFYARAGLPLCELMNSYHISLGGKHMYEMFCHQPTPPPVGSCSDYTGQWTPDTITFIGILPSGSVIKSTPLSEAIGLTAGVVYAEEPDWLEFSVDGVQTFVPALPIRNGLNWDHIYDVGAVYGTNDGGISIPVDKAENPVMQDAQVTIAQGTFAVTLPKGGNFPCIMPNGDYTYTPENTELSEWDRMIADNIEAETPGFPTWDQIKGVYSWCQESSGHHGGYDGDPFYHRVLRGYYGPRYLVGYQGQSSFEGWRPVLRKIA